MFSDTRNQVGIQVWDISNLTNPRLVEQTAGPGTNHHHFLIGDYYLNASGSGSLARVWDMADMSDIREVVPGEFPFIRRGGNQRRDWFPLPFVYTGHNGYHPPQPIARIVDSRTDEVLAELDYESDLGFPGQPLTVGNLLIVAASQTGDGVATYDVSDPRNPVLLDIIKGVGPGYEPAIYKHYVVLAMDDFGNSPDQVTIIDFQDPADLKFAGRITNPPGRSRYTHFQDDMMFVGRAKYDISDPGNIREVMRHNKGDEYLLPLGNMLATFTADSGEASFVVHQTEPDNNPPSIGYHLPADGAINQAVSSRIGLVVNETLDTATVNPQNITVQTVDGNPIPGIISLTDKDVINFHPETDLPDNETIEVRLRAGGLSDVSGNALAEDFVFLFSTGSTIQPPVTGPEVVSVEFPYPVLTEEDFEVMVTAVDRDETGSLEYQIESGEEIIAVWQSSTQVSHRFDQAGHYNLVVKVRDGAGTTAIESVVVTVVDSIPDCAEGKRSGPIFLNESTETLWVVNPDNDTITSISTETLEVTREIPTGREPASIYPDAFGNLWVPLHDDDALQVFSAAGELRRTIYLAYGDRPKAVLGDSRGFIYVSLEGAGEMLKLDAADYRVLARTPVGPTPGALALDPAEGRLFVCRFISQDEYGEVWELDPQTFSVRRTIPLMPETDPSLDTGNNGRGLPNYLLGLSLSPCGRELMVASKKDNIFRGRFRDGKDLAHDLTVRAITSAIDLATSTEVFDARIDLNNSALPSAVTFSPLGDYLLITTQGNNEINVVDRFTGQLATRILTGLSPTGIIYDRARDRVYTKDFMERTVSVFEMADFLRAGRIPVTRSTVIPTVGTEKLPPDILEGKQIFYNADDDRMSRDDYISCAVCHLDGGHDGRTLDFTQRGEGIRNNISLRGRQAMGHGFLHWTGNFNELQDFENDIRTAFDGEGFLPDEDWEDPDVQAPLGAKAKAGRSVELDRLAAYVASLGEDSLLKSPHRTAEGKFTLQAQRGRDVFNSANCIDCHAGPNYTDGARHDTGTIKPGSGTRLGAALDGIDTPTLIDLHDTAPYLHDGSAETLEEVFLQYDANAAPGSSGRAHDLSDLTEQEKNDLIRFLLELDKPAVISSDGYVSMDGQAVFEAENGEFAAGQTIWETGSDATASGDEYIYSMENESPQRPSSEEPARLVRYPVTLQTAGDYKLYVRIRTFGASSDSFFWRLVPEGGSGGWERWYLQLYDKSEFTWVEWQGEFLDTGDELYGLAAGNYVFEITYRENNTQLDKFSIQLASMASPSGMGPEETLSEGKDSSSGMESLSFEEWLVSQGLPSGELFDAGMGDSGYTTGVYYALGGSIESGPVEPVFGLSENGDEFVYTFVRYPTRGGAETIVEVCEGLDNWMPVAVFSADGGLTNYFPDEYIISENFEEAFPDGIVTTVRGTKSGERIFVRLRAVETAAP